MVGKSSFAVSFITSEWYYKVYQLSENLDLTSVVAGYLKSIEQKAFQLYFLLLGSCTIQDEQLEELGIV